MSSFCKSYSHFFSKNISVYAIFNDSSFNDTLTYDIVSFEQLDSDVLKSNMLRENMTFGNKEQMEGMKAFYNFNHCFGCQDLDKT